MCIISEFDFLMKQCSLVRDPWGLPNFTRLKGQFWNRSNPPLKSLAGSHLCSSCNSSWPKHELVMHEVQVLHCCKQPSLCWHFKNFSVIPYELDPNIRFCSYKYIYILFYSIYTFPKSLLCQSWTWVFQPRHLCPHNVLLNLKGLVPVPWDHTMGIHHNLPKDVGTW